MPASKAMPDERGEFELEISGELYTMRYSYAAIKELERHFKRKGPQGILEGIEKWSTDDHIAFLLAGLKRGSAPKMTAEELEEMLTLDRMRYYIETVAGAIVSGSDGGDSSSDEDSEEDPTTAG